MYNNETENIWLRNKSKVAQNTHKRHNALANEMNESMMKELKDNYWEV